jgi:hypothetical protein
MQIVAGKATVRTRHPFGRGRCRPNKPKPTGYRKDEPVNPPALGERTTRIEVDALRMEERARLRVIRNRGPMTMRQLSRTYKQKASVLHRILQDLDRFGFIGRNIDARGWVIIHATVKPAPADDGSDLDSDAWRACLKRLPKRLTAEKSGRSTAGSRAVGRIGE